MKIPKRDLNRCCAEHCTANISNGSNEEGSDRFLQPLLFQPRTVFTDGGGNSMTSWKWTSSAHQDPPHSLMLRCFTDSVICCGYKTKWRRVE